MLLRSTDIFRFTLLMPVFICLMMPPLSAHEGGHGKGKKELRVWTVLPEGKKIRASFLFQKGGYIHLEPEHGKALILPVSSLTEEDALYVKKKTEMITNLNKPVFGQLPDEREKLFTEQFQPASPSESIQADTFNINTAFLPFADIVTTRYDNNYFYVESRGWPKHNMMVGIRSWQQQVPLPQPYAGTNAWQIPLRPVLSSSPISAKYALFTGAIALAINGVAIFNALNNRGDDAYLYGELDQWGGHCGRADDYHYHIAPLHFEDLIGKNKPIGVALDGYPLYGTFEPDSTARLPLDSLNGHFDSRGRYHYHGTTTYPYINGGMRGVVSVQNDQIVPQPRTTPVRPFLQPLNGAVITGYSVTGERSCSLQYTRANQIYYVNYRYDLTTPSYTYTFDFVDPQGNTVTKIYRNGQLINDAAEEIVPGAFKLYSNYPNPFNPATQIKYDVPFRSGISITICNSLGETVAVPVNSEQDAGTYTVNWSASHLPSGVYYCTLRTGSITITNKMLLAK